MRPAGWFGCLRYSIWSTRLFCRGLLRPCQFICPSILKRLIFLPFPVIFSPRFALLHLIFPCQRVQLFRLRLICSVIELSRYVLSSSAQSPCDLVSLSLVIFFDRFTPFSNAPSFCFAFAWAFRFSSPPLSPNMLALLFEKCFYPSGKSFPENSRLSPPLLPSSALYSPGQAG